MRKQNKPDIEIYKGHEIFIDICYYDMFCVREVGSTKFEETIHFVFKQEAYDFINKITQLNT